MNFGEQFKKIRGEKRLTQEQVAAQLHISRQAVSNWENNKNLPDIEMIVQIAKTFNLSLDRLILGDDHENNIAEKLIKDGGDTRRAKLNLVSTCIGTFLLIMGVVCILLKAASPEYIDEYGILHENFFLLVIGFLFIFCGLIVFLVSGISTIIRTIVNRRSEKREIAENSDI